MKTDTATLRSIELFTGAGGLALGVHQAGFRHEALVEWNADACRTLRANSVANAVPGIRAWTVLQNDIRNLRLADFAGVDLMAGGAPCQPFSIGGKHGGMGDVRNMIPEYIRAVREIMPRAFVLENVRGLLRPGFRTYFSYIVLQLTYPDVLTRVDEGWLDHLRRLEEIHTRGHHAGLRYNVVWRALNAADYGVAQTRERVFVVGFRDDTSVRWHFPAATHSKAALEHDQWFTREYWHRYGIAPTLERPTERVTGTRPFIDRWRTVRDAIGDLPDPRSDSESATVANHRFVPGARSYAGHSGSPIDLPSKTLKAGDHGVPGGENTLLYPDGAVRYYTVREAARIQDFPDTWLFEGSWTESMRQLGNAVPVGLATAIATSVADELRRVDG